MDPRRRLDNLLTAYIADFVARNTCARVLKEHLDRIGVGLFPLADHLTFRTHDIDRRVQEFLPLGYQFAETLEYQDWYAKIFRVPGYPPLFIDQAYPDPRGKTSIIPAWVDRFGDLTLHHMAIRIEDIDVAVARFQEIGMQFAGQVIGERGGPLRQVFTAPEEVDGFSFSVLELTERREGYMGFSPPQADSLMKSTVTTPPVR